MAEHMTPVVVYAPGMGRYEANTANGVADVLATVIDRLEAGPFSTKVDTSVSAPKGLTVGKTIIDANDQPVLQLFELDYARRLDPISGAAGPPAPPGIIKSSTFAVRGALGLLRALMRPAKTWRTKLQLFLGFVAVGALILTALVALYAALVAAGVDLPAAVGGLFGPDAAGWTLGIAGTAAFITWSAVRKRALAFAATAQQLISYVENDGAIGDTAALTVDDAIDGLRQNGWTGNIHLLGYSFGSLVLFDALFPKSAALRSATPVAGIASLTTVGCPLDIVRLYRPDYLEGREERRPQLPWFNVFNAADVFASNLWNEDDTRPSPTDEDDTRQSPTEVMGFASRAPDSIRYLDEELGLLRILSAKGFRTHAGYWGAPDRANCFDPLVANWMPSPTTAGPDAPT